MSDVWNSFGGGLRIGDNMGRQVRDARAYQDGGLDAVSEAAGRAGDLEGMETSRGMARRQKMFEDEQLNSAYQRMEQIAPRARNIVRATRNMDPQRAGALLQQNRRFFEDWGFSPEQVDGGIAGLTNADPTVRQQWQEQLEAAFTQHQNPDWQIQEATGQIYAIDPQTGQPTTGGTIEPQRDWQTNGTRPYYIDENGQTVYGEGEIPHRPRAHRSNGYGGSYPDDGYDYEE